MRHYTLKILFLGSLLLETSLVAKNNFPLLPNGWHVHDMERPQPRKVIAGSNDSDAPSDAIVLFDGEDLNAWICKDGSPAKWNVKDGVVEVTPKSGSIWSKQAFGDIQLHIEWAVPEVVMEKAQRRGNSGIYVMGLYEIQIMDAWENPAYPDGMSGAVYGQHPALVNAAKRPGEWQSYDIVFNAPVFEDQQLVSPAYVTVFHNGVLVQNHTEIYGPTEHKKAPPYQNHPEKLPIQLQDHGQPVRFRNIWVREL